MEWDYILLNHRQDNDNRYIFKFLLINTYILKNNSVYKITHIYDEDNLRYTFNIT